MFGSSLGCYVWSLEEGEGVGDLSAEGVVWGELMVEEEVVFNCIDELLCLVPFSSEGQWGDS
jgi:hypothetical protein